MKSKSRADSILTEVVANHLLSVSEEVGLTMIRAAHSPNVRERRDCSTAIFDAKGQIIAQAPYIPMHLGSMVGLIGEVLKRFPADTLKPGDMYIANDPYNGGGSHLPDITLVSPVIYDGKLVAFVADIAHHADVGGMVPGSESAACTTIYQEGIRLSPVPVRSELGEGDPVVQLIMLNSRTPEERLGDLQAQMAALHVGVRRLQEVYDRFGAGTVAIATEEFLDYSERRARSLIRQFDEGVYSFEDYLDNDGFSDAPVLLKCTATVRDGEMQLDFSGTDPQMPSGKNIPMVATLSVVYCVVKMLIDPDALANTGTYRTIKIIAPEGCVVNPTPPAAIGARAISCGILGDVVVGALTQALPGKALASSGPHSLSTFAGTDSGRTRPFVDYETVAGGYGARSYRDGIDAVRIHASGAANLPVESLELAYPMQVMRYELVENGGGAGTFRGGMPVRRDTRMLAKDGTISLSADRQAQAANGLEGGLAGEPGSFVLNPGTSDEQVLPTVAVGIPLRPGDIVSVRTPGGGGFGSPLRRDTGKVLEDVLDGRVSIMQAEEVYGVVVRDGVLDLVATNRLRSSMESEQRSKMDSKPNASK